MLKLTIPHGTKILRPVLYEVYNKLDYGEEIILPPGKIIPIEKHVEIIQDKEIKIIEASDKINEFIQSLHG